jgi:hypothetical protein
MTTAAERLIQRVIAGEPADKVVSETFDYRPQSKVRSSIGRVLAPGEQPRYFGQGETVPAPKASASKKRGRTKPNPSCWGCGRDYLDRWSPDDLTPTKRNGRYSGAPICPDCHGEELVQHGEGDMQKHLAPAKLPKDYPVHVSELRPRP